MTTLQDIARDLAMHKSTVSLALSGKGNVSAATRERVIAFARERGYEPNPFAQRLARGFDNALVCLFCGGLDVGLTTEKVLLVQQALSAAGLDVPIYTCAVVSEAAGEATGGVEVVSAQQTQIRQICRQRPRAIICAANQADPRIFTELADYQRAGGIVVSYDSPIALACDQIVFDREDNAYQAARHLLREGHRRIGIGFTHLLGAMERTENGRQADDQDPDGGQPAEPGEPRPLRGPDQGTVCEPDRRPDDRTPGMAVVVEEALEDHPEQRREAEEDEHLVTEERPDPRPRPPPDHRGQAEEAQEDRRAAPGVDA